MIKYSASSLLLLISFLLIQGCSQSEPQALNAEKSTVNYSMMFGGTKVGNLNVVTDRNNLSIDYGFSNNGRGANSQETIILSDNGIPLNWKITGQTTFGNAVDEMFTVTENQDSTQTATWADTTGEGSSKFNADLLYVAQGASPYSLFIYANALLRQQDNQLNALPGGQLSIDRIASLTLQNDDTKVDAGVFAISGIELDPSYIALDNKNQMIAYLSPTVSIIRDDLVNEDSSLRDLAATLNASRFEELAAKVTHQYDKPVRINNVRIFNPNTLSMTKLQSVVIENGLIKNVEDAISTPVGNEVYIEGNGGSIIPGLYEMHGHMSDNDALLNVMAGVTSVRDMGNEIDVLDDLIEKIENGTLIGPRISKSAFIEGRSNFSAATGEIASNQQEAIDLVNMYADRGDYFQIKVYSSIKGEWVAAMAEEARSRGMRVAGHIPAFSKVDEMIGAGYNEITHINQLMLSWVLDREEDTRTLFRITGMKRFVDIDLKSEKVKSTLQLMIDNNVAIDPTIVIHEFGLTARNGETRRGVRDYVEHMPIGFQRSAKTALLNVENEQEDIEYMFAFEKILDTLSLMHEKGIFIVPGTDLGGAFELHRELELFAEIGLSNGEILKRASYDMANYLGKGDQLGSIEVGKIADFFMVPGNPVNDLRAIKTISLVSKGNSIYFPTEVYPEFGIKPFVDMPQIVNK